MKNLNEEEIIEEEGSEEEYEQEGEEIKKIQKIKRKLKTCQEEKAKCLESWQRAQADFINYRKMQEERNAEFVKYATQGLISELLSIMDTLEVASDHTKEAEGIKMQLAKVLKDNGVEEIKAAGEKFDPHLHEAVEHIESKKPDGEIVKVVQKGYRMNGKVLRVAIVKVAKQQK